MTSEFYGPRTRENARALIEAAKTLGVDVRLIRTTAGGYMVPAEVMGLIKGVAHVEEGVIEVTRVAPPVLVFEPWGHA